jgi:hypothetical protein
MMLQSRYKREYDDYRELAKEVPTEQLEGFFSHPAYAPSTESAIAWRAAKDEIFSRMPKREEIHDLTGYDL